MTKIAMGPLDVIEPELVLLEGATMAVVAAGPDGQPDVLIAQILCGAAASGIKTLMLLPKLRQDDAVWNAIVRILSGGDVRSGARELSRLPIVLHAGSTGRDGPGGAELVYAPGLTAKELGQLRARTQAPFLVTEEGAADDVIRVGIDILRIDSRGINVPVVYMPDGPLYCPA